jgi:hypothetical protein
MQFALFLRLRDMQLLLHHLVLMLRDASLFPGARPVGGLSIFISFCGFQFLLLFLAPRSLLTSMMLRIILGFRVFCNRIVKNYIGNSKVPAVPVINHTMMLMLKNGLQNKQYVNVDEDMTLHMSLPPITLHRLDMRVGPAWSASAHLNIQP